MSDMYRVVTSTKPQRQGEAFILRNNKFFLKVYRDVPCGAEYFARNLCRLLNRHDPLTAAPTATEVTFYADCNMVGVLCPDGFDEQTLLDGTYELVRVRPGS